MSLLAVGFVYPTNSIAILARIVIGTDMLKIEVEREADGRWIAEISQLPGVLAYGETMSEAQNKAEVLALRVIADRIERGESLPFETNSLFITA